MARERYRLACDRCDWSAETAGPRDAGKGGVTARLYCPTCGATRDCDLSGGGRRGNSGPLGVPLGPRDGPAARLARALARRLRGHHRASSGRGLPDCPVCGKPGLILAPIDGTVVPCPRCGVGQLHTGAR